MRSRSLALAFIFFLQTSSSVIYQSPAGDWKLRKSQNGVTVYSRREAGMSVDELKVESDVTAPLSTVVAVVKDAEHYKEWIYHCTESRLVKKVSDFEQYEYQVNSLPYPLSDRDIVVHFTMAQDSSTKIVTTRSVSVPDYLPQVKGMVRIPVFDGGYTLIPKPGGIVHIIYTLQIDPGGSLPDWLVNLSIVDGPYESTINMRDKIAEALNNHVSVSYIKD